ncbi:hypothetical protein OG883_26880 [Streptomyces sp. NBC_01142]|uniref:hypothetical protein n=1 Tax=Streptomyces sp. NBC_01142 TaxID=2975865 RepID=UPI00224F1285|nr:hypothetical protein [Streptomyces sp. NBC_01142]MCX4823439.1 hypothetical protein [Streptomyces sp. NBC_01142]
MSFEQEWAALRAESATRINSAGPGGAGGAGPAGEADLKTDPTGTAVAVRALEEVVQPGTRKAGAAADDTTGSTVREFTGWQTGTGLKDAHEEWGLGVKSLEARLANDKAALQGTAKDFGNYNQQLTGRWAALLPQGSASQ